MADLKAKLQVDIDTSNISESVDQWVNAFKKNLQSRTIDLSNIKITGLDNNKQLKDINKQINQTLNGSNKNTRFSITIDDLTNKLNKLSNDSSWKTINKLAQEMSNSTAKAVNTANNLPSTNLSSQFSYSTYQKYVKELQALGLKINSATGEQFKKASFDAIKTGMNDIGEAYTKLIGQFQSTGSISDDLASRYGKQAVEASKLIQTSANNNIEAYKKEKKAYLEAYNTVDSHKISGKIAEIDTYLNKNSRMTKEYSDSFKKLRNELSTGIVTNSQYRDIQTRFSSLKNQVNAAELTGRNFKDDLAYNFKRFSHWISATSIVFGLMAATRNAFSTIKQIDDAMIELKKVTDETSNTYKQFNQNANQMAKDLGLSTSAIIQQTAAWAQLGYSLEEAKKLSAASAIFKTISPELSTQQSTSTLVSIMKAYKDEGITASNVLDEVGSKINEVGNNFSATNKDIADILQRSASALEAGHNSLSEAIGLATSAQEIIQDASRVGNALKTLTAYAHDFKRVSAVKGLTGVSAFTDETESTYKSTFQYLRDINAVWDQLSDKTRNNVAKQLFSVRNVNVGLAILKNWETAEKAATTAQNAHGSAMREFTKATDSLSFKINRLKETGTGVWQNLLDSNLLKTGVDLISHLAGGIELLTKGLGKLGAISTVGTFSTLIMALNGKAFANTTGNKNISAFWDINTKGLRKGLTSGVGGIANLIELFLTSGKDEQGLSRKLNAKINAVANNSSKELRPASNAFMKAFSYGEWLTGYSDESINKIIDSFKDQLLTSDQLIKEYDDQLAGINQKYSSRKANVLNDSSLTSRQAKEQLEKLAIYQREEITALGERPKAFNPDTFADSFERASPAVRSFVKEETEAYRATGQFTASADKLKNNIAENTSIMGSLADKTKGFIGTIKNIAVGALPFIALDLAIKGLVTTYKVLNPSQKELNDAMNESFKSYQNSVAKIDDYNKKLAENRDKLKELKSQSNDTTNKTAIDNLTAENNLLQARISLEKEKSKAEAKNTAIKAMASQNKKFYTSGISEVTFGEHLLESPNIITGSSSLNGIAPVIPKKSASTVVDSKDISSIIQAYKDAREELKNLEPNLNNTNIDKFEDVKKNLDDYKSKLQESAAALGDYQEKLKPFYDIARTTSPYSLTKDMSDTMKMYKSNEQYIEKIMEQTDPERYWAEKFDKIYTSKGIEKTKEELIILANTQKLVDFKNAINGMHNLSSAITDSSIDIQDFYNHLKNLNDEQSRWTSQLEQNKVMMSNIESMTTGAMERFSTYQAIMKNATSVNGLINDGDKNNYIDALKQLYVDLENYNPEKLLEATSNGVRINYQELHKYNDAIKNQELGKYASTLEKLHKQYAEVCVTLGNLQANTKDYNTLVGQRDSILAQIKDTELLRSQYEGLYSAFSQWSHAMDTNSVDVDYTTITNSLEAMQKLRDEGKVGDEKFLTFLSMATGKEVSLLDQLSNADLAKTFDNAMIKMKTYFTEGSEGAQAFLDKLVEIGKLKIIDGNYTGTIDTKQVAQELGVSTDLIEKQIDRLKEYHVKINVTSNDIDEASLLKPLEDALSSAQSTLNQYIADNANKLSIDNFSLTSLANESLSKIDTSSLDRTQSSISLIKDLKDQITSQEDKKILGIDDQDITYLENIVEYLQKVETSYKNIESAKEGISAKQNGLSLGLDVTSTDDLMTLQKALQNLQDQFKNIFNDFSLDNVATASLSQIEEMTNTFYNALEKLRKTSGTIDINTQGGQEALQIYDALLTRQQKLNEPAILKVDTSKLQEKTKEGIDELQKLQQKINELGTLNQEKKAGFNVDTSHAEQQVIDFASRMSKGKEIIKTLGLKLDTSSAEAIKKTMDEIQKDTLVTKIGIDNEAFTSFQKEDKTTHGTVVIEVIKTAWQKFVNSVKNNPIIQEVKVNYINSNPRTGPLVNEKQGVPIVNKRTGLVALNGTFGNAYASGTRGHIRKEPSGKALGGELGPEIVVRDGKYFTIGDHGAEMFDYRTGDIIFDAKQSEALLKNGHIAGKSYAQGNAFARTTISGSILKKKKTTTSSKSKSASSSSKKSSSNKSSSSKSSETEKDPTYFDWIEIKIKRIEEAISRLGSAAQNVYNSWIERNSALNSQLSKTREEYHAQASAYNSYMQAANALGLSSSWKDKIISGAYSIEGIKDENLIKKIQKYKEYYDKAQDALTKQKQLEQDIDKLLIQRFENKAQEYEDKINTFKKLNEALKEEDELANYTGGLFNLENIRSQTQNNKQTLNLLYQQKAELTDILNQISTGGSNGITANSQGYITALNKIKEIEKEIITTQTSISKASKDAFDKITSDFESQLNYLESRTNAINDEISIAEARGFRTSESYYKELITTTTSSLEKMKEEKKALEEALISGLANGQITMYSRMWYDLTKQINNVDKNIRDVTKSIEEFSQKIKEIAWTRFDDIQKSISNMLDEFKLIGDLLSSGDERFNNNGSMRNKAIASLGLLSASLETLTNQSKQYAKELHDLEQEYANSTYDSRYIERKEKLISSHQSIISSIYKEKEAIKSLLKEGYDKQLSYLNELIKKRKEALSKQKEAYSYQKKITREAKNVANYQKQVLAYSSDASEEGRLNSQKARENLKNAQEALSESEWDQYISDTENLLDKLSSEAQLWINERLDHIDELITNASDMVNANLSNIETAVREEIDKTGLLLSDGFTSWLTQSGTNQEKVTAGIDTVTSSINNFASIASKNAERIIAAIREERIAKEEKQKQAQKAAEAAKQAAQPKAPAPRTAPVQAPPPSKPSNSNGGVNFIYQKDSYPKNKLQRYSSIVDALKYYDYASGFGVRAGYFKQMGGTGTYKGTASQNTWMLSKFRQIKGYSGGGIVGDLETIMKTNGDNTLTINTLKKGEAVIDPSTTRIIQDFNTKSPYLKAMMNSHHATTSNIDEININIELPNVQSYKDFRNELINDTKFDKAVNTMVSTALLGGNSLAKKKHLK